MADELDFEERWRRRQAEYDALPPPTPKPCVECPWARKARPGHLGPHTAEEWVEIVHGESAIACHKTIVRTDEKGEGDWADPAMRQCAGSAIFRANVCKNPRHPRVAVADEQDTALVFSSNREFIAHNQEET